MPSLLTAIFADSTLIILAVLGISSLVLKVAWLKTTLLTLGICFLIYIGWVIRNSQPAFIDEKKLLSAKQQILFTLSLSFLNPHALIDTIGVIGMNSVYFTGNARWAYTAACISVSVFWFSSLCIAGHLLHKIDKSGKWIILINKISALIIWSIAIYIASKLLF